MNAIRKPLMGLCPIGKFVFSHADALRQKEALQGCLRTWDVPFVDLEGVLEDGILRDQSHVGPVVDHFRANNVKCLFVPHCNFGTEGAVGMIARRLDLPTLLWGPRDEAPQDDGTRLRDTLCGMFASSKVMHKIGVPFTYIENCRLGDPPLREGLDTFLRAANVADVFRRGVRIGHIGQRIDFFWTTIVNESELLERFRIEVQPFDMVEFVRHVKDRAARGRSTYEEELRLLTRTAAIEGFADDQPMIHVLAVRDQMLALAEEHGLEGFAVQDFMSLIDELGAYCFYANSSVGDRYAIGCESDIHGAISDILLRRAGFGAGPAFVSDLTVRHPDNDNAVLLWHAGAPLSMRHPDSQVRLGRHWILPSPLSGMTHFRLKDGPITIARFDGDRGQYCLAAGEGHSIEGPATQNNYVWMEVRDWPRWERALMEGPFIHHVAMAYGHYADALVEAARYIPGLDSLDLRSPACDSNRSPARNDFPRRGAPAA